MSANEEFYPFFSRDAEGELQEVEFFYNYT